MEYGWGFAALMAGLLLTGLVFVVTGIQMACGRWRHALAGAAYIQGNYSITDIGR